MSDVAAAAARMTDAFVAALARLGVHQVCLCPGSRSTPLALAFARQRAPEAPCAAEPAELPAGIRLWVHLDERSAGYFALGMARAARRPVALVCTSGTAAANFLPAVVEAYHAQVPLIVCTADRPPELHHVGANQTIEQQGLYGAHARLAADMPLPDGQAATARYAAVMAGRAVAAAFGPPAGPVHLNFRFREPLVPEGDVPPATEPGAIRAPLPVAAFRRPGRRDPDPEAVELLAALLRGARRALIVCGGQDDLAFPSAVTELAERVEVPLLADPLSGLRRGPDRGDLVIDSYDAILRDAAFAAAVQPDLVLRFGMAPTSKPLLQYLERQQCPQVLIGDAGWADPTLAAGEALEADPVACCARLGAALLRHQPGREAREWSRRWQQAQRAARRALEAAARGFPAPFEGRIFIELEDLLPDGATLFAGNSMPVRDLDTLYAGSSRKVRSLANRGASGIDGVVSSALGVAALSAGPVVLVIGDLSFYHDMNGLLAAKRFGLSLTIVLVNNDGGGIFSFLPQVALAEHFEPLFGTPHGLDFAPVADLYSARYTRTRTWAEFRCAVGAGVKMGGLHIVEVQTDRAENVRQHRELWRRVSAALGEAGVVEALALEDRRAVATAAADGGPTEHRPAPTPLARGTEPCRDS